MTGRISPRLLAVVDALPLRPGMRVLEIGCGPGAAAREIARRVRPGRVLGIDRSAAAIARARAASCPGIEAGILEFLQVAAEDFALRLQEAPYDLAVAIRVGALDGRHPRQGIQARARIAAALTEEGRLLIGEGAPLHEVDLGR